MNGAMPAFKCPKLRNEALESVMCDVIKIRLKSRDETRGRKGTQPLNIKTVVERSILKLGLPIFKWSFYFTLLLVAFLLFRRFFFDVTHDTFQRFQCLHYFLAVLR